MADSDELQKLKSLVSPDEIIEHGTDRYTEESLIWDAARYQAPKLLLRPKSVEQLAKVIAFLGQSNLDFAVRSLGFGNANARDVIVSLRAFDDFEWDAENEVVTVGVGQTWVSFYEKMEKAAPDHAAVACRTPSIGVGGSILHGGFSWLSSEYGCTSDPVSMLDAQVVKLDGSVIWASKEPDLLWALRGAGANFAIVTKFKLRAFKYPTRSVWAGPILLSAKYLPQIAKGITDMSDRKQTDVKIGLFLYMMRKDMLGFADAEDDILVLHVFDALGEEHGRSDEAFGWAFKIPGVIDHTEVKTLLGISLMQQQLAMLKGKTVSGWTAVALSELPEDIILKSFEWWSKMQKDPELRNGTFCVFELFCTRDVIGKPSDTAWPRPKGIKHEILLGMGCDPSAGEETRRLATQALIEGPDEILGKDFKKIYLPNALEPFHKLEDVYGEHLPKLLELKKKYDPRGKLKGEFTWRKESNGV